MSNEQRKPRVTKDTLTTGKRLLGYVLRDYKLRFIGVFFCIIVSPLHPFRCPFR